MEWCPAPAKVLPIAPEAHTTTDTIPSNNDSIWDRFSRFGLGKQRIQGKGPETGLESLFERWSGVRDEMTAGAGGQAVQMDVDRLELSTQGRSSLGSLVGSRQGPPSFDDSLERRSSSRSPTLLQALSATYMLCGIARVLLLFAGSAGQTVHDKSSLGGARKIVFTVSALEGGAGMLELLTRVSSVSRSLRSL